MEEIKSAKDIQKLLYQKVPQLIEKLDSCKPEQYLIIIQALKEISGFTPFTR